MIRYACQAAIFLTAFQASAPALASQQNELEQLRQRISALQQEMDKADGTRAAAADALRDSERAISQTNRQLHQLALQQREASASLARHQQQAGRITSDMKLQQQQLARLLYQQYLDGRQESLKLLLNNHDPSQAARELRYYEYIAQNRAAWLKTMRGHLQNLQSVTRQAQQKQAEISALQAEQEKQKNSLLREKAAQQQVLNRIALQLKQQRREIDRLQQDEARLGKLFNNLTRVVTATNTETAATPAPTAGKNPVRSAEPIRKIAFISLKGRLQMPVVGKVTNKFGTRRPDSPLPWKGLFIAAPARQSVNAIAAGTVIYADWLRGFGNLLIIDHGAGYMSLYGNNEALYHQVGDELKAGETIAVIGNSGGNENYGLYFELRHQGNPLDPARWLRGRKHR